MDIEKYYLALGRFVDRFADMEDFLFIALQHAADVEIGVAKAVFSGTRVVAAMDAINRIHEVRGIPVPARLAETFLQLRAITKVRDHVLHSGVREFAGKLQSVNQLRAHAPRSLRVVDVSPEFMDDLTADLDTAIWAISVFLATRDFEAEFTAPDNPNARAMLAASLAPWRYRRP